MKTQREICSETGIPKATFGYWRREGLVPAPSGIQMREATWPDEILDHIREIQRLKALGQSLADIRARFKQDAEIKSLFQEKREIQKRLDHLKQWNEPEQIRKTLSSMLGIKCGIVSHLTGVSDDVTYCWATVSSGDTVYLAKVHVAESGANLVESIQLTIEEYSEIVAMLCRLQAGKGDIFDIRDLAARAFMLPDNFKDIRESVQAKMKLRDMGQAVLEDVVKLKAKSDFFTLE